MRATTVLRRLLALKHTRVLAIVFAATALIVDVAPSSRVPYCAGCWCRAGRRYDRRRRTWRHLDFGGWQVLLRYAPWRVDCSRCGVTTELVPWAEHGSGFTLAFEQLVTFLAQRTDQTTVCRLMRIAWDTVGRIARRVADRLGPDDPLEGLVNIGIDELSYRRHHEYLTIVSDQDTGSIVWAWPGKNAETLHRFFDELGAERSARLQTVTIDMAAAYIEVVRARAAQARLVFDRFHVQRLAQDALDAVRREQVRIGRQWGDREGARAIKRTRFVLQKRPWNLEGIEHDKLAEGQRANRPLYRAYLLKETLAAVLDRSQVNVARIKLREWIGWALRSRLAPFAKAARTVREHLEGIVAYVATGFSNGRAEGLNGKVRTITRRAYGFHDPFNLIALILLCCGGLVVTPPHQPSG